MSVRFVHLLHFSIRKCAGYGHFIPRAWAPNIDGCSPHTSGRDYDHLKNLKNQALQGFLVDALARRGEERRGTLR